MSRCGTTRTPSPCLLLAVDILFFRAYEGRGMAGVVCLHPGHPRQSFARHRVQRRRTPGLTGALGNRFADHAAAGRALLARAKWLLIRAINQGRAEPLLGVWPGRLAAPRPPRQCFRPPRGERQPPLECLAKSCSAPCHIFALFSTGVGQKTVDNSNAKPMFTGPPTRRGPQKTAWGERNSSPFPRKASFDAIGVVLSPPKAAPKE
jgi:hypothetical protein